MSSPPFLRIIPPILKAAFLADWFHFNVLLERLEILKNRW
jgi:hypothetical protein